MFDKQTRAALIDKLTQVLNDQYVFPVMAKTIGAHLSAQQNKGVYDSLADATSLAQMLTDHVQAVSSDLHLRVLYDNDLATALGEAGDNAQRDDQWEQRQLKRLRYDNFGFEQVQRLKGNIGYLDLRGFYAPIYAGDTAVAAMNFLANTKALIFDLRRNGGGDPAMIQLLCSYLFAAGDAQHLNSFYWRPEDRHQQFWTLPYVPGKRLPDIDVYILTSRYTFSAAEEFTYNLKNLKRAVVVGETTGGGAHPGGPMALVDGFVVWVPMGRAINPVTKMNWEGTGVMPDIEVAESDALKVAHVEAVKRLIQKAADGDEKQLLQWKLETLEAEYYPQRVEAALLSAYAGQYGAHQVVVEAGELHYLFRGLRERLTPMSSNMFVVNQYSKLCFRHDDTGQVIGFTLINRDGSEVQVQRTH